jgi:hypothetical protein
MNSDHEYRSGRVPLPGLPGSAPADPADRPAATRRDGIRHVRRVSNWTAATLIVGTGAATVALAHQAFPVAAPTAGMASTAGLGAVSGTPGATGPQATHSVATTSASGVTVTTTTRTVNGQAVVTHVRHAPAWHDN